MIAAIASQDAATVGIPYFLALLTILSALFFAVFRRVDKLQGQIIALAKESLDSDRRIEARLDIHDREMRVWNKVAEDRLLKSFEHESAYRGTATEEERRHIGWVRRMGADSPTVTTEDIRRVIQVIDRELDLGNLVENKVPEAKYELQRLNRVLARKQAESELFNLLQGGPDQSRREIEKDPWWRFW